MDWLYGARTLICGATPTLHTRPAYFSNNITLPLTNPNSSNKHWHLFGMIKIPAVLILLFYHNARCCNSWEAVAVHTLSTLQYKSVPICITPLVAIIPFLYNGTPLFLYTDPWSITCPQRHGETQVELPTLYRSLHKRVLFLRYLVVQDKPYQHYVLSIIKLM